MLRLGSREQWSPLGAAGVTALADLATDTTCAVQRLLGGRMFASRLAAMGVSIGAELTVLRNNRSGPVVVMVRGTRIALGRREAGKVLVEIGSAAAEARSDD
ncbi:MAG: FeoA family protein [Actinomycetota bacterium]